MTTVKISLNTVEKVKGFVNTLAPLDGDFDLVSDRYVVDAKSIMGIFSLDLSKPLTLQIHNHEDRVLPLLAPYIVE
ncbi:MAG: HPr family phosphocarrier protein [Defluviitaleaceae bacterium]|nr:HPr family phosphocarrier protein [Defluviitaleaceae bacterium]